MMRGQTRCQASQIEGLGNMAMEFCDLEHMGECRIEWGRLGTGSGIYARLGIKRQEDTSLRVIQGPRIQTSSPVRRFGISSSMLDKTGFGINEISKRTEMTTSDWDGVQIVNVHAAELECSEQGTRHSSTAEELGRGNAGRGLTGNDTWQRPWRGRIGWASIGKLKAFKEPRMCKWRRLRSLAVPDREARRAFKCHLPDAGGGSIGGRRIVALVKLSPCCWPKRAKPVVPVVEVSPLVHSGRATARFFNSINASHGRDSLDPAPSKLILDANPTGRELLVPPVAGY
ncbi:hypothetical protein BKA70DRAFT_1473366 [Coprinopsis sp. MPI-PUGE-AT-0042]|nr:hypothetical protein BKA70DRAFT_1473366 [Coprinopsis sp. MPI-PUGE-AT-0042]